MKQSAGFTIIEVILFLTVSSALTLMLMVGTGSALQRQQYRESVQSFASFLRSQYSRVISVENDRSAGRCPIPGSEATNSERGQSNCVVVGRYIVTTTTDGAAQGKKYNAYQVYGMNTGTGWQYALSEASDTEYQLSWSAKSRLSTQSDNNTSVSILMYRDPEVGNIVVRADSNTFNQSTIGAFISGTNNQLIEREVCIYDNGWLTGENLSVFLGSRAGSADAITVKPASGACA